MLLMKETRRKTDGHTWLSEWSRLCPEGLSRGLEGKGRPAEERVTPVIMTRGSTATRKTGRVYD